MDKDFKNIDQLFKNTLGSEVKEAPTFVKGNIDKVIGFRKRKRFIFFGLTTLLLAVVSVMLFTDVFSNQLSNKEFSHNFNSKITQSNNPWNFKHQQKKITAVSTKDEIDFPTQKISTKNDDNNSRQLTIMNNIINKRVNNQSKIDAAFNQEKATENEVKKTREPKNDIKEIINDDTNQAEEKTITKEKNEGHLESNKTSNDSSNNTLAFETNDSIDNKNVEEKKVNETKEAEEAEEAIKKVVPLKETEVNNLLSGQENSSNLISIDTNSFVYEEIESDTSSRVEKQNKRDSTDNDLPEINNDTTETSDIAVHTTIKHPPWMLSLTSGINLQKSNYTSNSGTVGTLYNMAIDDRLGYQASLELTYRTKKSLTLGTGFTYNRSSENYSFIEKMIVYDTTFLDTVLMDTGMFIVDTSTIETLHEGLTKNTTISFPFTLGTQLIIKKFRVDFFAMIRANFIINSSGGYFSNSTETFIPFDSSTSIYKPFHLDFALASRFHYNFYKNLYLTGKVQFRPQQGNSLTGIDLNKSFRYTHFGAGISIRL